MAKKKNYHEYDLFDVCKRCGRTGQNITEHQLKCISDEEVEDAAKKRVAGVRVYEALKRIRRQNAT